MPWRGATRAYVWWEQSDRSLDKKLIRLAQSQGVSKDSFNIYYFGGSTVKGVIPGVTIPEVVDETLGGEINGHPVRSVNVAARGQDLEYNLVRLRHVVEEKSKFHPSVVVIYSGHNEFLKYHSRFSGTLVLPGIVDSFAKHSLLLQKIASRFGLYRLESNKRRFFDEALLSKQRHEDTIQNYEAQLAEAVGILAENGIPAIISTVAGNYSEWQPNRSVFCADESDQAEFTRLMYSAQESEDRSEHRQAIDLYKQGMPSYSTAFMYSLWALPYSPRLLTFARSAGRPGQPIMSLRKRLAQLDCPRTTSFETCRPTQEFRLST